MSSITVLLSALTIKIKSFVLLCRIIGVLFVCDEVLRPSQPNGVMSSMVSLPNHKFTGHYWSFK